MSDRRPLMPKATAVWLVENTSLSFEQIAEFCGLHVLEVKGIADGDVAQGIKGMDPISNGQLSREEIALAEEDHDHRLTLAEAKVDIPEVKTKKGPRYTPVSRRHDRPNAVVWLLRNHAELKDSQIMRLVGTTKPTIAAIRDRTHWNSANLTPQDPVTLGLCSQTDLDAEVRKAAKRIERERKEQHKPLEKGGTLLPTSETIPGLGPAAGGRDPGAARRRGAARGDRGRGAGPRARQAARDGRHQDGRAARVESRHPGRDACDRDPVPHESEVSSADSASGMTVNQEGGFAGGASVRGSARPIPFPNDRWLPPWLSCSSSCFPKRSRRACRRARPTT